MMKNLHSHLWKLRAIESLKARQIKIFEVQHMQHFMLDKDCKFEADIIVILKLSLFKVLKSPKFFIFGKTKTNIRV